MTRRRAVFVDRISPWSVLAMAALAPGADVWHFEPLTAASERVVNAGRALRLLRGRVRPVDANVGQLRDADGSNPLIALLRDARRLSNAIRERWVLREPMLHALAPEWPAATLAFHLDRLSEASVREERLRVALCAWLVRRDGLAMEDALLLVAAQPWLDLVAEAARADGLRVAGYPELGGATRILVRAASLLVHVAGRGAVRPGARSLGPIAAAATDGSTLGLRYGRRAVSLDPDRHTELFWLDGLEAGRIVLYDHDGILAPGVAEELRERGITVTGTVPQLTGPALRVAARLWLRIWGAFIAGAVRHRRISFGVAKALSSLALEFASWRHFFSSERIRVNVVASNGSSGQVMALDALRGISVNYQYSISNIVAPTTLMMAGETVQLVYSPAFAELTRAVDPPTKRVVCVGPLSDGAERAAAVLRRSPRVDASRRRLVEAGAAFVICYFDENSADRWDLLASNAQAAREYEFLVTWLEEDAGLGLVVKPKKPWDLRDRIAPVAARLDRLVAAGRCVIVGEHDVSRDTHVAEAALAADLCIGKLNAGTAAFEARLVGIRSIMVDVDALRDHPLRSWGEGRVVFDGWEAARAAVDAYRRDPGAHAELGDWSPGMGEIDPFGDGRSVERMRGYVRDLLRGLRDGLSVDAALASADTGI